jgi:cystathionine beta-lyase family protein involved in aluminum resistance
VDTLIYYDFDIQKTQLYLTKTSQKDSTPMKSKISSKTPRTKLVSIIRKDGISMGPLLSQRVRGVDHEKDTSILNGWMMDSN